ncbi:MAG: type II secretion system protein GspG [Pseudomonadota bacterium]|nr:type II secretion system protein GspG [Pseudomonadota bacterium]
MYTNPGVKGTPYSLQSYGADGQPGGTSENSDIILK